MQVHGAREILEGDLRQAERPGCYQGRRLEGLLGRHASVSCSISLRCSDSRRLRCLTCSQYQSMLSQASNPGARTKCNLRRDGCPRQQVSHRPNRLEGLVTCKACLIITTPQGFCRLGLR